MPDLPPPLHIGFPLFPELTQLDLTGPWEVLTRIPGAIAHALAPDTAPVRSASGLALLPTTTYAACPQLDILCVPGGPGHLAAMQDAALLDFLRRQAHGCRFVTSVCTGAMVLAAAGLLAGYRATTHWMSHDRLAAFGAVPVAARVVVDRNRITGGGVTAGIDFGLALAAMVMGEAAAQALQLHLEYDPAPPFPGGSPASAPAQLIAAARRQAAPYLDRIAAIDAAILAARNRPLA